MSGSSGTSFGVSSKSISCEDLIIRTQLASPDPDVLVDIHAGDVLYVKLLNATGPIQAITMDGRVAGAILTSNPTQLINCISAGTEYQAKVFSINGGDCQITVYCAAR
ncbi:hypothetical protein [Pedobacter nanyangensis]|uniref:hypothetical protein n=1 Tax=Pedobacter nanyangensis TaxID=1562389 RepID=UPI000DE32B04|nr:hypothetical protein [Pedobacter nanyangensis]